MIVKISKLSVAPTFPSLETKSLVPSPAVSGVSMRHKTIEGPSPIIKNPFVKKFAGIAKRFS